MKYCVFIFMLGINSLQAMQPLTQEHKQEIKKNIERCIFKRYVRCLGYLGKYSDWSRDNEELGTDLDNLSLIVEKHNESVAVKQKALDDFTEKWKLEYIEFEDLIRR